MTDEQKQMDEVEEMGEYAIVGFEVADEEAEQLIYYTVDYGYPTEEEAWDALESYAAEGILDPGDYGVIMLCSGREPLSIEGAASGEESATAGASA